MNLTLQNHASQKVNYNTSCNNCPICQVTFDKIVDEGIFTHLLNYFLFSPLTLIKGMFVYDNMSEPLYNDRCWSMRLRYHTAPECIKEELRRNIAPVTKFRWTLKSAYEGKCIMPDVSSPSIALANFMKSINETIVSNIAPKKTILMVGLSFMGQPYMSFGCMFSDTLRDAKVWEVDREHLLSDIRRNSGYKNNKTAMYNLKDITANNGQCTGFSKLHIVDFYPTEIHPNIAIPKQNMDICSVEHSMMTFHGISTKKNDPVYAKNSDIKYRLESLPSVNICYEYTYNIVKNVPPGHDLPCGLSWDEIDIVLSLDSVDDIFNHYIPNTGGDINKLSNLHLVFVDKIYRQEAMLIKAYNENQLNLPLHENTSPEFRAKYKECNEKVGDIHYRMPGIPDQAMISWLSMIATGMNTGYKMKGVTKYWD